MTISKAFLYEFLTVLSAALIPLCLSSCNGQAKLSSIVGHYEGFLFAESQSSQGQEVSADVSSTSQDNLLVVVQQTQGSGKTQVTIHVNGPNSITVDTDSGLFEKQGLTSVEKTDCFKSSDGGDGPTRLQFCGDGSQVSLIVSDLQGNAIYNFQLSRLDPGQVPQMEQPADYTIAQLVDRAKSRSFQTVVEFQKVLESRIARSMPI